MTVYIRFPLSGQRDEHSCTDMGVYTIMANQITPL